MWSEISIGCEVIFRWIPACELCVIFLLDYLQQKLFFLSTLTFEIQMEVYENFVILEVYFFLLDYDTAEYFLYQEYSIIALNN